MMIVRLKMAQKAGEDHVSKHHENHKVGFII